MKETPIRTFVKGISYRIISSLATFGIVLFFTGNIAVSLGAGVLEFTAKFIIYYFHERAWTHVSWGNSH